jgi:hypothetical protein
MTIGDAIVASVGLIVMGVVIVAAIWASTKWR